MEKKKTFKVLIITFLCVIFAAGIILAGWIFFKPGTESSPAENEFLADRYFIAQTAIFHNEYSQNYNGTYKFERVNFAYLSKLSSETQAKIYKKYKVSDTMGLLNALTKEKSASVKSTNEILIIEDGTFQFNHNLKPYLYGEIFGNDDYSVLYNSKGSKLYTASLSNLSEDELKDLSSDEQIKYHGAELYLTKTLEIELDDKVYNLSVVYVYKIQK